MFWKSKTKNSGMYNTLSIPANLVTWTQSGTNWNGILTEATMLANNIDYTRVMNVVPQWANGTNSNGWVTTISRSSADNNIYITLTRGGGGSQVDTSHFVTTDTQQTITAAKQFDGAVEFNKTIVAHNGSDNDCGLAFHREANRANFVGFFSGNTRLGYIGKNSANDTNFSVGSDTGNIVLRAHTSIDCNNKKLINVATPTANNDAATKAYADSPTLSYTKITTFQKNNITSETWSKIFDNVSMSNNFTIQNTSVYEVLIKVNDSNADFYSSVIVTVNAANYDNIGTGNEMLLNQTNFYSVKFAVKLNQNHITIFARKVSGSNSNTNFRFDFFIRKVGSTTLPNS